MGDQPCNISDSGESHSTEPLLAPDEPEPAPDVVDQSSSPSQDAAPRKSGTEHTSTPTHSHLAKQRSTPDPNAPLTPEEIRNGSIGAFILIFSALLAAYIGWTTGYDPFVSIRTTRRLSTPRKSNSATP